jgi:putative molybdopterin biosynthesis protein
MHAPLLDPRQIAQILHVSRSYVYQILRRGDLPAVKLGTALRVRPEDLQEFITRKKLRHTSQFLSVAAPGTARSIAPAHQNRVAPSGRLR